MYETATVANWFYKWTTNQQKKKKKKKKILIILKKKINKKKNLYKIGFESVFITWTR